MTAISVALATYNGERYLEPFLASVRAQDWPDVRLVVSDDGSTDRTRELVASLWPGAAVHRNTAARGVIGNFSNAMTQTGGGYVALADQDDIWEPTKLSSLMRRMQACEARDPGKPVMVFSDLKVVDSDLNVLGDSFFRFTSKSLKASAPRDFLLSNHVPGCTMLLNDALLKLALPVPAEVMMHDWWLALVAAAFGTVDSVEEPLVLYRQHGFNTVGAPMTERLFKRWFGRLGEPMRRLDSCRRQAGLARGTLVAFRDRFGDTAPPAVQATLRTMLDGHAVGRLREIRSARTGETRMKAAVVATMI
jgi:glycosyltransferase involved in cell wall biosynthesis